MLRKRKISKRKKTKLNISSAFSRRCLNEEDIGKITGTLPKKQITTIICKKSAGAIKCSLGVKKNNLTPLERLNLMTTSGNSKHTKSGKSSRQSSANKSSIRIHSNNGEVRRLYSPFNRFSKRPDRKLTKNMPYQSQYSHVGLSPKEKCYLISTFQSKASRYAKLKSLATRAMEENKIFTLYGSCNIVRKALLERGWVEKITPNKMNLSRIRDGSFTDQSDVHNELERLLLSNLVEKCPPSFIWEVRDDQHDTTIDMNKENLAIVNKLKVDAMWTSKQGLCSSMKTNYWFYIENVADVNSPRTYNSYESGESEGFVKDFQITACTSLLKWILSMVANERPIFLETGHVSLNVMVFALNRCKEYLLRKQNKDIDRALSTASNGQWVTFLKKYYCIIGKDDVFTYDKEGKLPLYLMYAKFLLKEMHKYRPQLSCEGCHNIWIIKPAHCSRGRGIKMASKLAVITSLLTRVNAKYVIQKYIEEPLLIHETKFDIRQYYLVTSTYPLVIWMYQDCYLKFSSQKYNLRNFHESIHLTNNAVQRRYKNCHNRHPDLPENNMWSLDKYKDYLKKIGKEKVWDNVIYPGMKKSIVGIMLSCQDSLSVSKNRFELYGCDFILDKSYKPWLIEINSCPDLNPTTQVTAKICPAVVVDIIRVVIDHAQNPKCLTGKFECIYRQPLTLPRYGCALDLVARGHALSPDYFYKGKLQITESYGNAAIEQETDIHNVLTKLKRAYETNKLKPDYETDIMVEPDDDVDIQMVKDAAGQNTESEYELSVAAIEINAQIEELIDRITSDNPSSCSSEPLGSPSQEDAASPSSSITQINVKSNIGTHSMLQKTDSNFILTEESNTNRCFKFSELDDGPTENTSTFKFHLLRKAIKQPNVINTTNNNQSYEEILKVTSKIVSFIEKKEREHYEDIKHLSRKR